MNHNAAHCSDYREGDCPATCYRALLTRELRKMNREQIVPWAHFKGTEECGKSHLDTRRERFAFARERAGLSQMKAHIKSGVALSTIKAYESEEAKVLNPRWNILYSLAKLYGVDPVWLMEGDK